MNIRLSSLDDTLKFGRILASELAASGPPVLLLQGELGSGKTTLVRALAEALPGGTEAEVSSPSFTLCNCYDTTPEILHFDLYRLKEGQEEDSLLDALDQAEKNLDRNTAPALLIIVEWPDRLSRRNFPQQFLYCRLTEHENNRTALLETQTSSAENDAALFRRIAAQAESSGLPVEK